MDYAARIYSKLSEAFHPELLEIQDDSEAHRGHGGYRDGGQTHFSVKIRAEAFRGQSRVAAQRAVMAALREELAERVHALVLDVAAP